jgi:hypothetical protein
MFTAPCRLVLHFNDDIQKIVSIEVSSGPARKTLLTICKKRGAIIRKLQLAFKLNFTPSLSHSGFAGTGVLKWLFALATQFNSLFLIENSKSSQSDRRIF